MLQDNCQNKNYYMPDWKSFIFDLLSVTVFEMIRKYYNIFKRLVANYKPQTN